MLNVDSPTRTARADEYERLGVVTVRSLLNADEVAQIRSAFMDQVARDSSVGHDDHVPDDDPLKRYPRFVHPHRRTDLDIGRLSRRWMLEPRVMSIVTELVGPVFAAQSMFYFKPPTARGQALHQDNLFLQAHPETCIAAWIAIDDCDAENGGLRMVPRSHRYEIVCPDEADAAESFTNTEVKLPEGMAAEQTVLKAGDVLFFHGSMVHGSGPNRSTDRFRRSLIFHYVPQSSTEIARFYNPLLTPGGDEIVVAETADGGACGEGWTPTGPH
ncbi:Ectoine hydroxylase-related dioxygenase, phytanoyl-CoA dioxygenase (PhyH) family [Microbacterium sp. cf046]|uniref:phytanoyl-CoA dioxygenase family protein n=1 Tax=Microbacterium sp. cf046 TaxID=1761803 RepID=UPI0008DF0478|nr:phytanoyl-CoA dioxygenase family protein [Microbacterium sp. cf046]SFS03921.1 Ectoine hydroxylase-related dioxygenase, phytanoyl-CoA dioxygenase (PhyH) family [Microbacterium sp. cf046]